MNKRIPILLGFLLLILAVWLQVTSIYAVRSLITRLDYLAYDVQLRTRIFTHFSPPTSPVVIVDIDDKSLQVEGRWPWSRDIIGNLLDRLHEQGAVVIALDMMFPENENNIAQTLSKTLESEKLETPQIFNVLQKVSPEFNNDAKLAMSLSDQDAVLGMTFLPNYQTTGLLPSPLLVLQTPQQKGLSFITASGYISNISLIEKAAKHAGFINVYPDADGIIRRVPLVMRYKENIYPSMALAAVKLYLLQNVGLVTGQYNHSEQLESIQLGNHTIPVDAFGQMLVPFRGKSFTFPYYSALDVLNKKISPNALQGKIVFLGTSATGISDLRATSVQAVFPGVEIQATIADAILSDRFSYKPEWTTGAEVFMTISFGLFCIFLFPFLGPRSLSLIMILFPLTIIFLNNLLWEHTGLVLFTLLPIVLIIGLALLNMTYGYLFESRRREKLKEMFGQYVPEKHIDEMLHAKGSYALYGEDREMTVLFADIRNFTGISEPLAASELKELLNQFFTPMTKIIFRHRGTIDKYIGDLIMAFWGAPLRDKHHVERALYAALDMQTAIEKINPNFVKRGWGEIKIGISINTGTMSVGDMGSQFRRNYTVLGDAVNLGSRLEGLTKYYGVKIMTSAFSQKNQMKFLFRKLDKVLVKGKANGVEIYEVMARLQTATEDMKQEVLVSEHALELYFHRQWDEAYNFFKKLQDEHPEVRYYQVMLKRIEEFQLNPPPENWDGIFAHSEK